MNYKTIFILTVAFALAGGLTFASMTPYLTADAVPPKHVEHDKCGPNNDKEEPPCGSPKKR